MGPEIEGNVLLALGLTLFAGLATGLGALVVFFSRRLDMSLLSFGLGLSSGVMIYISLVELLPQAAELMAESFGETARLEHGLVDGAWESRIVLPARAVSSRIDPALQGTD